MARKPSDVSEDEWAFVAPYLNVITKDAPQRDHPLREVFNGLWYVVQVALHSPSITATLQSTPESDAEAGYDGLSGAKRTGGGYIGTPAGSLYVSGQRVGSGSGERTV